MVWLGLLAATLRLKGPGTVLLTRFARESRRAVTSAEYGGAAICAVGTCCSDAGVYLGLLCGNPSVRLTQIAQRLGSGGGRTSRIDGSNRIGLRQR